MLNEYQQRFLERYLNSRGNIYGTLDDLGLDLSHLISWRDNPEFELNYRDYTNKLISHLKQESYILATKKVNEVVKNGLKVETLSQEHKIAPQGNEYRVKRTSKDIGVPVAYLKLALSETAISKAITTLANEGVIPLAIAKKIMQKAEAISQELADCFEVKEDENVVSEQKIIAFIKQAVLQGIEE
jgi:hypothetical protein